jgi:Circularly permutated YpsA SLOG family
MKIISGGQSGVDRAALDAAIARGIDYGGWCPKGGWAEDHPRPPGVLAAYPRLMETPLADPAQRTEWNVRDADACLIIVDAQGLPVSTGTALAHELAGRYRKPLLVADLGAPDAIARADHWLGAQHRALGSGFALAIGGPRESEAPGIYDKALDFIRIVLTRVAIRVKPW